MTAKQSEFMRFLFFNRWLRRPHAHRMDLTACNHVILQDPEAQFKFAQSFSERDLSAQTQAMHWYLKAAEQGHCAAQFHLAQMHAQGKGGLRDEAAALLWLRRAAEAGHGGAQYHLGVRLYRASKSKAGSEASELRIESFRWLNQAVAQSWRGAESAREFVLLGMTQGEAAEGEHRAHSAPVSCL